MMKNPDVIVRRVVSRLDGMGGVLLVKDPLGYLPLCLTLEDPWRNNIPGDGSIPAGVYSAALVMSKRFNMPVYQLLSVPGREAIEMHKGNTNLDTHGCILLGSTFTMMKNFVAVANSEVAFNAFMARMKGAAQFIISVEDAWGGSTAITS